MQAKISPSLMCLDFSSISKTIFEFEQQDVDLLHVDIMDGEFVPNFTLGVDFCNQIRQITKIPLDIHLMIERPELKIQWFAPQPNEYFSVHWESTTHIQRVLEKIRSYGAKAVVALNPGTPICMLDNVISDVDAVLLMAVNPGYAGQQLVQSVIPKITALRNYLDERGYSKVEIEVDGNVSFQNAEIMRKAGANIFVGGSSSVFYSPQSLTTNLEQLRWAIV
ncbi:MAG: ribulose-phosphate 3-epimerase [Angelakisella sp.]|nr:ribulose-phosphate 3-epimerase [Angelakisella sp.]